jgi:hypothetical protein
VTRFLLTIACWLAFAVAPGETQRSMTADIPPIVGNEQQRLDNGELWGPMGMSGVVLAEKNPPCCAWREARGSAGMRPDYSPHLGPCGVTK